MKISSSQRVLQPRALVAALAATGLFAAAPLAAKTLVYCS